MMRRTDKRQPGERLGVRYRVGEASNGVYYYQWRKCIACDREFKIFEGHPGCRLCCPRCEDEEKCPACGPDVCNEDGAE
jgi:hypothetical protein